MVIIGMMELCGKSLSDAETHKFAEQIKKIVEHFNAKNCLDYGSGSDLNKTKLVNGEKFIDYVGLKKLKVLSP